MRIDIHFGFLENNGVLTSVNESKKEGKIFGEGDRISNFAYLYGGGGIFIRFAHYIIKIM